MTMQESSEIINLKGIINIDIDSINSIVDLYEQVKNNPKINIIRERLPHGLVISFEYKGEVYYWKYDRVFNSYNELVAEEIAKDLDIPCIDYQLADIGKIRGVISKNYKVEGAKYINGQTILKDYHQDDFVQRVHNSLENIWIVLEERYKDRENMQEIVSSIMQKLVKIFIFDILTGQVDRNSTNWEIVEYMDGTVDLQALFDNSRILYDMPEDTRVVLSVDGGTDMGFLDENIEKFQMQSSSEYTSMIAASLWVIDEDNIKEVIERVEEKTKQSMPEELKEDFIAKFKEQYDYINLVLYEARTLKAI